MPVRQPEELHAIFVQAFNAGDLEGVVGLYDTSAVFLKEPGRVLTGTDAIREDYRALFAAHPHVEAETRLVMRTEDGIALTSGKWTMTGTNPDGTAFRIESRSAEVLRRQPDGTWLAVIDCPSIPE